MADEEDEDDEEMLDEAEWVENRAARHLPLLS
jgi:hypothetical protein